MSVNTLRYEQIVRVMPEVRYPPSALTHEELVTLAYVTEHLYTGNGAVCDLGCGKGGSTFALCYGLSRNPRLVPTPRVNAYDWLEFATGPHRDGESTIFWKNVAPFRNMITLHIGDLLEATWGGDDIEILFVDIAKELDLFTHVVSEFYSALVPGLSLIIHQDFGRPRLPWLHYSTGMLLPFVDVLGLVEDSLILKLAKKIPDGLFRRLVADDFSVESRIRNIRLLRTLFSNDTSRGIAYSDLLSLSEAFVYHYAGRHGEARRVVERLNLSDAFVGRFGGMMGPLLHD